MLGGRRAITHEPLFSIFRAEVFKEWAVSPGNLLKMQIFRSTVLLKFLAYVPNLEGLENSLLGPTPRFLMLLVQGPHSENNSLEEYLVLSAYRVSMLCRAPGLFHLVHGLRKGLVAAGGWVTALSLTAGALSSVRLTHWRQQVLVGGCAVGRVFLSDLRYWHTLCLAPDTFLYFYHCYKMVLLALFWGLPS